jgi:2-hydroxy-6-oxonona-2,4-dienedioate hydrolase
MSANGEVKSKWTKTNGVNMHASVCLDQAPPGSPEVVLVHGLVVSSSYMRPLIKALTPGYRVYAPDLPGFGLSSDPGYSLTIPELAEALHSWIETVGLRRPLILGNSFGCQIAIEFGHRYPGRARGLVLVGPTVDRVGRNIPAQAARWMRNSLSEPPSLGPELVRDYFRAGLIRSFRTLRMYVRDEPERKLPSVTEPVRVIRGSKDPIVPARWAREVANLASASRPGEIPGIGHTANYSAPLEVARMTRLFDQKISRASKHSKGRFS